MNNKDTKNVDELEKKEKLLTWILKFLLIVVIIAIGLTASMLIAGYSEGNRFLIALSGGIGGLVACAMGSISRARINIGKLKINTKVKRGALSGLFLISIITKITRLEESVILDSGKKNNKDKSKDKSKAETVTELFLIDRQNNIADARKIAVWGVVVSSAISSIMGITFGVVLVFFAMIAILQIKEEILIYRVRKGYFGSTTREAMMLINFIDSQDDDSDINSGGRRKAVFKEISEEMESIPDGYAGAQK